jgi:hypothetical protein
MILWSDGLLLLWESIQILLWVNFEKFDHRRNFLYNHIDISGNESREVLWNVFTRVSITYSYLSDNPNSVN